MIFGDQRALEPFPGARLPPREQTWRIAGLTLLTVAAAGAFGALASRSFSEALILLGVVVVVALATLAPFATLALLLFLAVLIPQGVHEVLSVGASPGRPGLALVDLLVVLGVARVGVMGLRRHWGWPFLIACALLVATVAQTAHGVADGWPLGEVGQEARRVTLALGGFLLALPVLHDPAARRRLPSMLLVLGACLGTWGLLQWALEIDFAQGADVGVRDGVALTSAGKGQLQGGLYAYPTAVILAFSFLVSGHLRGRGQHYLVGFVLVLNALCLLLTYERTFWAAAGIGCFFVLLIGGANARRRALKWGPPALVAGLVAVAAIAPGELRTAVERFSSVSQYGTDSSLEFRREESRTVVEAIRSSPLLGSGLGAAVTWGHEWRFGRQETAYAHVGYLWLSWKFGLPVALSTLTFLAACVLRRDSSRQLSSYGALRTGAQGSILGILIINLTFPAFNALGVTAVLGLLAAIVWVPAQASQAVTRDSAPGQTGGLTTADLT